MIRRTVLSYIIGRYSKNTSLEAKSAFLSLEEVNGLIETWTKRIQTNKVRYVSVLVPRGPAHLLMLTFRICICCMLSRVKARSIWQSRAFFGCVRSGHRGGMSLETDTAQWFPWRITSSLFRDTILVKRSSPSSFLHVYTAISAWSSPRSDGNRINRT